MKESPHAEAGTRKPRASRFGRGGTQNMQTGHRWRMGWMVGCARKQERTRQAHEGAQVRLNGTTTGVLVSAGIPAGTLPGQDGSPPGRRR